MPEPIDLEGEGLLVPPVDQILVLDLETYYADDYGLRVGEATTEAYVRDPRFQVIGVGVCQDEDAVWLEADDFAAWAAEVDWSCVGVLAHNTAFDGLVLSHHFGIVPGFYFDTLSMGRVLHSDGDSNSLHALGLRYGVGEKGDEVERAKNKRREDFTPEEWAAYGAYCMQDCRLTERLFALMSDGYPLKELWHIDAHLRMFTRPTLSLDLELLAKTLEEERARKVDLLRRVVPVVEPKLLPLLKKATTDEHVYKAAKKVIGGDQFADVLRECGVEVDDPDLGPGVGVKYSAQRTNTARKKNPDAAPLYSYAFAKTDPFMKDLLESADDTVRLLAECRVAVKSTIVESRTQRLLNMGRRGLATVFLKYGGAHTFRSAGGDKTNFQNFGRGSALRRAIRCAREVA